MARNGRYKGGRVLASNGYIIIRVGKNHHLADVRGYAYEHRVVAEKKLGRRLRRGEIVHHVDGDKTNNSPANVDVVRNRAIHRFYHRSAGSNKRNPGQRNPLISCACGCRVKFRRFDAINRPRKYVSGHNGRKSNGTTN